MSSKVKPWPCVRCDFQLAEIVYGQLYIKGELGVTINTDGPNVVCRCPECGERKVWYSNDRLSSLLKELAKEVAVAQSRNS